MNKSKHKRFLLSILFISILTTSTTATLPLQIELTRENIREIRIQRIMEYLCGSYGPIILDPGPGDGSGGEGGEPSTYYEKTLLLINTEPSKGDPQAMSTADIFSEWNWNIDYSTSNDKTEFLQSIRDSDFITTNKLAITYIGHGDIENGIPYLKFPDGSTVTDTDLNQLSEEKPYWHLRFVLMTACHSMDNDNLAYSFNKLGATVVIGGVGEASVALAKVVADDFYYYALTEHYSVEEAFIQSEQNYNDALDEVYLVKQDVFDNLFGGSEDNLLESLSQDFWGTENDIINYLYPNYATWSITAILAILIIIMLLLPIIFWPWFVSEFAAFPYRLIDYDTDTLTYI